MSEGPHEIVSVLLSGAAGEARLPRLGRNARPQKRYCTTICTKVTGAARTAVMLDRGRARNLLAAPRLLLLSTE